MALIASLIDGVDDEGDQPRVCMVWAPFWAGAHVNPNQTAVPASPRQLARDCAAVVGLEGLSTSGVYELCLDSSPGLPFLDRGCRYLSALCSKGFE